MRKHLLVLAILLTATPAFAVDGTVAVKVASTKYVDTILESLNQKVDLGSAQTITGVKTFSASPIVPTPALPQAL